MVACSTRSGTSRSRRAASSAAIFVARTERAPAVSRRPNLDSGGADRSVDIRPVACWINRLTCPGQQLLNGFASTGAHLIEGQAFLAKMFEQRDQHLGIDALFPGEQFPNFILAFLKFFQGFRVFIINCDRTIGVRPYRHPVRRFDPCLSYQWRGRAHQHDKQKFTQRERAAHFVGVWAGEGGLMVIGLLLFVPTATPPGALIVVEVFPP